MQPQRVVGGLAVLQLHRLREHRPRRRLQDALLHKKRNVPARQIRRRHAQLAGREHPADALAHGHARRSQRVPRVGGGVARVRRGVAIARAAHAQRLEKMLRQKIEQRPPRDLLQNRARQHVVRVAVLPARARIEVQWLPARPVLENRRGRGRLCLLRNHVILRRIVLVAGGVREQLANGDLAGARDSGNISTPCHRARAYPAPATATARPL